MMWTSPRFGHTHIQNPSDTGIPYNPDPKPKPNRLGNMGTGSRIAKALVMGIPKTQGCPCQCNSERIASTLGHQPRPQGLGKREDQRDEVEFDRLLRLKPSNQALLSLV